MTKEANYKVQVAKRPDNSPCVPFDPPWQYKTVAVADYYTCCEVRNEWNSKYNRQCAFVTPC